ncbi:MAG: hypothetical protein WC796_00140 [Candidatus Pacearchaeota archaeon]|jgi:hypothetical protein
MGLFDRRTYCLQIVSDGEIIESHEMPFDEAELPRIGESYRITDRARHFHDMQRYDLEGQLKCLPAQELFERFAGDYVVVDVKTESGLKARRFFKPRIISWSSIIIEKRKPKQQPSTKT